MDITTVVDNLHRNQPWNETNEEECWKLYELYPLQYIELNDIFSKRNVTDTGQTKPTIELMMEKVST